MKKIVFLLVALTISLGSFSQTNEEIARVYIKRASENYKNLELEKGLKNFNKAMEKTDSIKSTRVARLGILLNYDLKRYKEAQKYSKQFFVLNKTKKSKHYNEILDIAVTINEKVEEIEAIEKKKREDQLKREREIRRIDSLKSVWTAKSKSLSFEADSIYKFNKSGTAILKKGGKFGLLNDVGNVVIEPTYATTKAYDNFILFLDKEENPTKILCYSVANNNSFEIPSVKEFNTASSNYGTVTFPRKNGRFVAYPDNVTKVFVFDLNEKKIVRVSNVLQLIKKLKKEGKVGRTNKEGQVRINKVWYIYGGYLGDNMHALYTTDGNLHGYLNENSKQVITRDNIGFAGIYDADKTLALKNGKQNWVTKDGSEAGKESDTTKEYEGISKITKLENGNYQILRDGKITLGEESLEKLPDFLKNNKE